MEFHHVSILLEPCLEALQIKPDGVYVDATTGGAGHSLRIAERLHDTTGRLICIDRDDEALETRRTASGMYGSVSHRSRATSAISTKVLEGQGLAGADGILFDLGVSSHSWIMLSAVFPICRMRRSICAWTGSRS